MRLFIVVLLLLAACAPSGPQYVGGRSACAHFGNVTRDAAQGILLPAEVRSKLQDVRTRASTAEPEIRDAATGMLSALTQGKVDQFEQAARSMFLACERYGY